MTDIFNTTQAVLEAAKDSMKKAEDAFKKQLDKLRTGRASSGMLENIRVEQPDGSSALLGHISRIVTRGAQELLVTPHQSWDKSIIAAIQKAITNAELGLNPSMQNNEIRVYIAPLSQDRRKDFVKLVRKEEEAICNEVRNHRRDAKHGCKLLLREKTISEDEDHRTHQTIQTLTDDTIANIRQIADEKEKQIMQI